MNQKQRRKYDKFLKRKNLSLHKKFTACDIVKGDEVMLDVDLILEDKDRNNPVFIEFVENSRNIIYHAEPINNIASLIGLQESPFMFWFKEIIKL